MVGKPQAVLVLMSSNVGDRYVAGSEVIMADCGHECWIAPSSKKLLDSGVYDLTTKCGDCTGVITSDNIREVPGGREELSNYIGPLSAERVVEKVREQARRGTLNLGEGKDG